MNQSQK